MKQPRHTEINTIKSHLNMETEKIEHIEVESNMMLTRG
jgi:hypothetical protein